MFFRFDNIFNFDICLIHEATKLKNKSFYSVKVNVRFKTKTKKFKKQVK